MSRTRYPPLLLAHVITSPFVDGVGTDDGDTEGDRFDDEVETLGLAADALKGGVTLAKSAYVSYTWRTLSLYIAKGKRKQMMRTRIELEWLLEVCGIKLQVQRTKTESPYERSPRARRTSSWRS